MIGSGVVIAALIAGGATAWAVGGGSDSGYRMAQAVRTNVSTSMDVVGTLEPVNQAAPAFAVSGQVTTVSAAAGQSVTAGQTLATLATTALSQSVSSAQSSLAADEAQLTEDEEAETSSAAKASTTTTTTTPSRTAPSGGTGNTGASTTLISKDQATLVADQQKSSTDQQQEAADLAQAESVCAPSGSTTAPSTAPGTTGTGGTTGGAGGTGTKMCIRDRPTRKPTMHCSPFTASPPQPMPTSPSLRKRHSSRRPRRSTGRSPFCSVCLLYTSRCV